MPARKDTKLYDLLEVSSNATDQEIKKAFHKASLKYHPDRNPEDPHKYKEISAAYDVLKDPKKRGIYDCHGVEGLKEGMGGAGGFSGMPDILRHMFGMGDDDDDHGHRHRGPSKGKPHGIALKVTLETLYNGETKKVPVSRKVLCKVCNGTGGKSGKKPVQCRSCNGKGARMVLRQMGPFVTQDMVVCHDCAGEGETISEKDKCRTCHGQKVTTETKHLEVNILQGSADGKQIKFRSEHDQLPGVEPGDVIVVLKQEPHGVFQRSGDNLIMKMTINLAESLCGFERIVKHLDKRSVLIKHPPAQPITPGTSKRISDQGMINMENHHTGDLIILFDVEFPPNFFADGTAIKQLESLLPAKPKVEVPTSDVEEAASMTQCTYKASGSRNSHGHNHSGGHDDEDDEDMDDEDGAGHHHAHAIPCQTQ